MQHWSLYGPFLGLAQLFSQVWQAKVDDVIMFPMARGVNNLYT